MHVVIHIYIKQIRILEDGTSNVKYNSDGIIHERLVLYNEKNLYKANIYGTRRIGLDWGYYAKIDDTIVIDKDNKNK